jgi:hypothetical protein
MSSCPSIPLTDAEKDEMRRSREDQLREIFREAILSDLLLIYTTPHAGHGSSPVDELLEAMDAALGVDKKRIFIESLKESILTLEGAAHERSEGNSVQAG